MFSFACGYVNGIGSAESVGEISEGNMRSLEGINSGEIYLNPADAPEGTLGCN